MVSGQDIIRKLGFRGVTSPRWRAFVGRFRAEFLEPREDICRGYQYFLDTGNRIAWDQCILQMFAQYPEIWAQARFPGEGGVKERFKYGQAFLVSQTKKFRASRNVRPAKRKTQTAKRKRANDAGSTGPPPKIRRLGDEKSFIPREVGPPEHPPLEFPRLICRVAYEKERVLVAHDSVRRFDEMVGWILEEFDLPEVINMVIRVPTAIRDPELEVLMRSEAPGVSVTAHDQASWSTAVLNAHLNRDPDTPYLKFVAVEVEVGVVDASYSEQEAGEETDTEDAQGSEDSEGAEAADSEDEETGTGDDDEEEQNGGLDRKQRRERKARAMAREKRRERREREEEQREERAGSGEKEERERKRMEQEEREEIEEIMRRGMEGADREREERERDKRDNEERERKQMEQEEREEILMREREEADRARRVQEGREREEQNVKEKDEREDRVPEQTKPEKKETKERAKKARVKERRGNKAGLEGGKRKQAIEGDKEEEKQEDNRSPLKRFMNFFM